METGVTWITLLLSLYFQMSTCNPHFRAILHDVLFTSSRKFIDRVDKQQLHKNTKSFHFYFLSV